MDITGFEGDLVVRNQSAFGDAAKTTRCVERGETASLSNTSRSLTTTMSSSGRHCRRASSNSAFSLHHALCLILFCSSAHSIMFLTVWLRASGEVAAKGVLLRSRSERDGRRMENSQTERGEVAALKASCDEGLGHERHRADENELGNEHPINRRVIGQGTRRETLKRRGTSE